MSDEKSVRDSGEDPRCECLPEVGQPGRPHEYTLAPGGVRHLMKNCLSWQHSGDGQPKASGQYCNCGHADLPQHKPGCSLRKRPNPRPAYPPWGGSVLDNASAADIAAASAQTCGREIFGMPGSVDVCTLPAGHDGMHRHQPKEAQMDLPDARARLASMATDKGETWDLSPRDQEAIRIVLGSASPQHDAAIVRMVALVEGYQALYAEACEVLEQQDDVPADVLRSITRGESKLQDRVNAHWPGDSGALPATFRYPGPDMDRVTSNPSTDADRANPPACHVDVLSSRSCERGTRGCTVGHGAGESADLETVGTVYRNGVRDGRREAIASSSAVPSDMGRAVSWLQKWVYSGDDGPNLNTLLAALLADVRRETIEACANVASIPVLRDEPHRIVRNISNLATMSAETIAKLAEKKP